MGKRAARAQKRPPCGRKGSGAKRAAAGAGTPARAALGGGKGKLKVEYVPIGTLQAWKGNPRKNEEAVAAVVQSIERFGYTNPILVRRANREIIAGHTRVKALEQVGETHAPVIFLDLKEADAHVLSLFDNKSVENTPWDREKLGRAIMTLEDLGAELELTGFNADEIAEMRAGPEDISDIEDEIPEPPKKAITKPGDLWILGDHRLLCGDATITEDVGRVTQGPIDFAVSSPPYNIGMRYSSYRDNAARAEYLAFIKKVAVSIFSVLKAGHFVAWNVGVSPKTYHPWQIVTFEKAGFSFYRQIVWEKAGIPYPLFTTSTRAKQARHYRPNYTHEMVAVLSRGEHSLSVIECPTCEGHGTVEPEPLPLDETHEIVGLMSKGEKIEMGEAIDLNRAFQNDVWHIPQSQATVDIKTVGVVSKGMRKRGRPSHMLKEHPAPYPVKLPAVLIGFLTAPGEHVYDPFLGAGSTLIAADKTSRRSSGLEIDPQYCDVIVERWEQFTGGKAKRQRGQGKAA